MKTKLTSLFILGLCVFCDAFVQKPAASLMIKAGAIPMTAAQYVLELQRDWGRADTYDAVTKLFLDFGAAYGIGLQYAKAALKH